MTEEAYVPPTQKRWTPSWGNVRGRNIHMACASQDEIRMCWRGFYGPDHDGATEPCEECGRPLNTPVPLNQNGATHEQEEGSSQGSRAEGANG